MIVSNTTPLSNLVQLDRLDLLELLFGRVTIPRAVERELDEGAAIFGDWRRRIGANAIEVVTVSPDPLVEEFLRTLHSGESEALTLAIRSGASILLVDDIDARRAAAHHRLSVAGTLGVLLLAKRRGLITEITPYLDRLRDEVRFWFSAALHAEIRKLAGEP